VTTTGEANLNGSYEEEGQGFLSEELQGIIKEYLDRLSIFLTYCI